MTDKEIQAKYEALKFSHPFCLLDPIALCIILPNDYAKLSLKNSNCNCIRKSWGDRFLSSAGTGKNCVLSMRVPNPSPVLDNECAPMGPEISRLGSGGRLLKHFQTPILYWIISVCENY